MASSANDPATLQGTPLLEFARRMEAAGLDYALIGGQAVNTWVRPRITDDFDFVVLADRAAIERFEAMLRDAGFIYLRRQDADSWSGPDFIRMRHPDRVLTIDLQVSKLDYQDGIIERARSTTGGVPIATREDLLIMKLIANRSKDHKDLLALAALDGLDWEYVELWAERWEVAGRLRDLRAWIASEDEPGVKPA